MTNQLRELFRAVEKAVQCYTVKGDILPLPADAPPDKQSLLVNCFFEPAEIEGNGAELLARCKQDTSKAFVAISRFIDEKDIQFDNVGVAIIRIEKHYQNTKVYFANSKKHLIKGFTGTDLSHIIASEGSHLDEINSLIM